MRLSAPVPLAQAHEIAQFDCGLSELNEWLLRRARSNQASGASRTFVVCNGNRVLAYYALASGAIKVAESTGRFRRNMPDPIPVAVLARLAIDLSLQGRGIGRALVRDAAMRLLSAAEILGIRGLLVHAISEDAAIFYQKIGFKPSPSDPMILMVGLNELQNALDV